ncbi:MAG TPA: aldo/keto reductase [Blastocatellia bacterium]|nr:aldo/keto reductase [Blastocatellia bacterium]
MNLSYRRNTPSIPATQLLRPTITLLSVQGRTDCERDATIECVEHFPLKSLAGRLGITVPQLAIAWALANPAVDVAIVGARRPQQLSQTAPAADVELSEETLQEIAQIMKDAAPTGGPSPEGL